MSLKGKRVAVLVEQQYQEMEVWYPVYRLREAGCQVTVVGPEAGQTYASKLGYPAKADKSAKDVKADDFDGVVIPGGFSPDYIRRSEAMLKLVRDLNEQKKVVAAICHGPWVLCSTTALKGKRVTCFHSIKDDVTNAGGKYVDQAVVRDGNIITGGGVTAGIDFALALIAQLRGAEAAQFIQLLLEYAPEPPFDAGLPETAPPRIREAVLNRMAATLTDAEQRIGHVARQLRA